jgi:hypothetical protein
MVIKILSAISGNATVVIKRFFSTFSVDYKTKRFDTTLLLLKYTLLFMFVVRSDSWFDVIEG